MTIEKDWQRANVTGFIVGCHDCVGGQIKQLFSSFITPVESPRKAADVYARTHDQLYPDHRIVIYEYGKANGG